jgi:hypothetical protein
MLKGKSEIVKNLNDSFVYCIATVDQLDDPKILSSPQMTASCLHTVVHNDEVYLRLSGIVPPSTELMKQNDALEEKVRACPDRIAPMLSAFKFLSLR